jgi:hypothetical protein
VTAQRIVVALDARTRPEDLQAAAALAGGVGAELLGLFIEDLDLLRFAALPIAHEIGHASAVRRKLDLESLERALRAHAGEVARALERTARSVAVPWSFRVARGVAAGELLGAAMQAAAASLAEGIRLLLPGDGESPASRWAEAARATLAAQEAALRLRIERFADLGELARALREDAPAVVVLQGREIVLARQGLASVLRDAAVPVLVLPARF